MTNDKDNSAPFIYFDAVSAYGAANGVSQVELIARKMKPNDDGAVISEFITVAHLRCSPAAARDLRNALDAALRMHVDAVRELNSSATPPVVNPDLLTKH
jgi:hypothetical protein